LLTPALPALCAIAILSGPAYADSLNHDESQFTGWLHAVSEMDGRPIRYHSQPIADFPQKLARINREINAYPFNDSFDEHLENACSVSPFPTAPAAG
jgi:hypothetical protein